MRRRTHQYTSNLAIIYGWIISLIWPFGMVMLAMKNFRNKQYRFFILLFFMFYGYTFIIGSEGHDAFRHKEKFEEMARQPNSELGNIIRDFVTLKGEDLDIYAPLANYFVSRFTDNAAYVFAFHALIFGIFYLKSISFIYDEFKGRVNKNAMLFLFLFIAMFSIHLINAVRFYTSMWLWIYGALQLLSRKKLKYIIYCLCASLIHFGITPATFMLLLYYFLGPRNNIYIPLVFISFVVGNFFQFDFLVQLGSGINAAAEKRAQLYTNTDIQNQRTESFQNASWFILLRVNALHYYLLGALAYLRFKGKDYFWDKKQEYLFSFLMLYLSFVNFVIYVPSLGGRMRFIFWAMTAYFLYRFFQINRRKSFYNVTLIGLFPILLYGAVEFRINTEFTNILALIGDPFLLFFNKTSVSVYDVIFKH